MVLILHEMSPIFKKLLSVRSRLNLNQLSYTFYLLSFHIHLYTNVLVPGGSGYGAIYLRSIQLLQDSCAYMMPTISSIDLTEDFFFWCWQITYRPICCNGVTSKGNFQLRILTCVIYWWSPVWSWSTSTEQPHPPHWSVPVLPPSPLIFHTSISFLKYSAGLERNNRHDIYFIQSERSLANAQISKLPQMLLLAKGMKICMCKWGPTLARIL